MFFDSLQGLRPGIIHHVQGAAAVASFSAAGQRPAAGLDAVNSCGTPYGMYRLPPGLSFVR